MWSPPISRRNRRCNTFNSSELFVVASALRRKFVAESYQHITRDARAGVPLITITTGHLREPEVCYAVRDEIRSALDPDQTENILLDMQHVEFIGSIGFLVFIALRRMLSEGEIVLCGMTAPTKDAFAATQLISDSPNTHGPFEFAPTVDAGVEQLNRPKM